MLFVFKYFYVQHAVMDVGEIFGQQPEYFGLPGSRRAEHDWYATESLKDLKAGGIID